MSRLTLEERSMLAEIDEADEGFISAKSPILRRLIAMKLVYIWEDGNFERHTAITPAGRQALSVSEKE